MFWCCSSGVIRQTQREGQVAATKRMVEGLAKDTFGRSRETVDRCNGLTGAFGGSPITSTQNGVTLWVCNAFSSHRWSLMASEGSDDASAFRCFLYEFLNFSISSKYWSLMKLNECESSVTAFAHVWEPACVSSPWLWKLDDGFTDLKHIVGSIQTQSKTHYHQKKKKCCFVLTFK